MNTLLTTPARFRLRLPDGTEEILTDDDWNRVVILWHQLVQVVKAQSLVKNCPNLNVETFLRGLVCDVLGFGGEHSEEVFYRRYGAGLTECIRSQAWFGEVSEMLASLSADPDSLIFSNPPALISRRRSNRLSAWEVRAEALAKGRFHTSLKTTWTSANAELLLARVAKVANQLDKEDLEILLNTGLPLRGSPEVRRRIEEILCEAMDARFHEQLLPDPWACVWQTLRPKNTERTGRRARVTRARAAATVSN